MMTEKLRLTETLDAHFSKRGLPVSEIQSWDLCQIKVSGKILYSGKDHKEFEKIRDLLKRSRIDGMNSIRRSFKKMFEISL